MDLKLTNGDLDFDNLGRIKLVSDKELIIQSIQNRLNTNKTELFYNYDYGIESMDRLKSTQNNRNYLQTIVERALLDDENISKVEIIDILRPKNDDGLLNLIIAITLLDGSIITLEYFI